MQVLIDAGLLPTTFTTLKLGEAHGYFHTNPGALTFLDRQLVHDRAPSIRADKGGQPADFPLGIMKFPAVPGRGLQRVPHRSRSAAATSSTPRPKNAKEVSRVLQHLR